MTETPALSQKVASILSVIAPVTLLVGLLYYFGWVRTGAIFAQFGIDQKMLDYGFEDYVVRSAGVAFRPLALALLASFGLAVLAPVVRERSEASGYSEVLTLLFRSVTLIALVWSSLVLFGAIRTSRPLMAAIVLALSTIGLAIVVRSVGPAKRGLSFAVTLANLALVGLLLLSLFWATSIFAQSTGMRLANGWLENPQSRPAVTIYSEERLQIAGEGDIEGRPIEEDRFPYVYGGLRLLTYSNSRWFLFYEEVRDGGDLPPALVLIDEPSIRVQVSPVE